MHKITYEQRVQEMAEKMANRYVSAEHVINERKGDAKIAVAAQAEAIRELDRIFGLTKNVCNIEKYLMSNGYAPVPEVNQKDESPMEFLFGEMCTRCKRNVSCCKHKGLSVCLSCCNKLAEED